MMALLGSFDDQNLPCGSTRSWVLWIRPPGSSVVALVALLGGSGHPRSEARLGLLARLLDPEPCDVEGGQEEQGQQGRNEQAADDGVSHWSPEDFRGDRDHPERGGGRGQHDRPKAVGRRIDYRV